MSHCYREGRAVSFLTRRGSQIVKFMLLNIPLLLALENQKKTFHLTARQFDVSIICIIYDFGKCLMHPL